MGAQKAATSSLHSLIAQHSQVAATNIKETGFFFRDELYKKGYDWYQQEFFSERDETNIFFEADPNYMCFPICLERLKQCKPDSKIIVMLRNPIERLVSSYMMMQRYELEHMSFEEAIRSEPDRILKGAMERETFNYVERSMYANQIRNILDRFSKEQVLFITFEGFVKNQEKEFNRVQSWLGLNIESCESKKENASFSVRSRLLNQLILAKEFKQLRSLIQSILGRKVTCFIRDMIKNANKQGVKQKDIVLTDKMSSELYRMFRDDIIETEKLTGLDLSSWRDDV